jgi:hypothetical protein
MNQAKYDSLPADLKKVIDANSGAAVSAQQIGRTWLRQQPGRRPQGGRRSGATR